MYGLVYKVTNRFSEMVYIGQTTIDLNERIRLHIVESKNSYSIFYNELFSLGINDVDSFNNIFDYEVISKAYDKDDLDSKEIYFIKYYDSDNPKFGYNTSRRIICHNTYDDSKIEYMTIKECSIKTGMLYTSIQKALKRNTSLNGFKFYYSHKKTIEHDLLKLIRKHNITTSIYYINNYKINISLN